MQKDSETWFLALYDHMCKPHLNGIHWSNQLVDLDKKKPKHFL